MINLNYSFQSMDFSLYSKYNLKISIKINREDVINIDKFKFELKIISGINKVISISKIRKIRLIIKNWILKGVRFKDRGSNPHSKGEDFSRFWYNFFEKIKFSKINKNGIKILNNNKIIKVIIYIKG